MASCECACVPELNISTLCHTDMHIYTQTAKITCKTNVDDCVRIILCMQLEHVERCKVSSLPCW